MITYRPLHFRALSTVLLFLIGMAFSASLVGVFWNWSDLTGRISSRTGLKVEKQYMEPSRELRGDLTANQESSAEIPIL